MSNPNNSASVIGNLASDPKIMPHSNGTSGTALITVYARNNYRDKDGNIGSVRVDLEEFVSDVNNPGIYAFLAEGMLVAVNYSVANADYTDKTGQQVYGMKLQVNRGGIQVLESKADTAARQARKAQNTTQTQAPVQQTQTQQAAMPQPNYAGAAQPQTPAYNYAAAQAPAQNPQAQSQPAPAQAPVDPYSQVYMPGVPVAAQNAQDEPPF